jgi:stage III sporulation protein AB
MLKIIGAVLTVAVGAAFGMRASDKLRLRYKKLLAHTLFISEASDMMRMGATLSEIYTLPSAETLIAAESYTAAVMEEGLRSADIRLLSEFYASLGMGDTEAEIARCSTFLKIMEKRLSEAEQDMKSRSRLYSLLGVFSGLFVAILLM